MTVEEAKEVQQVASNIEIYEHLKNDIKRHYHKKNHEEVANIALELADILVNINSGKLANMNSPFK